MQEWFETWFDSPYYHTLYAARNAEEAAFFINNLIKKYKFSTEGKYCDLACGKGRHSAYLNAQGYDVTGLDLSPNSIKYAKASENARLKFFERDMRHTFKENYFDAVFNFFTSFGYFESNLENQKALVATAASIKPNGMLVLDYMNSRAAIETFQTSYVKTVGDIAFQIEKYIEKGYIFKTIKFNAEGRDYAYTERVKLLFLEDFQVFFEAAGLELLEVYGNYALDPYDKNTSSRLIMVCQKSN
jgi:2-polyprenyl-3-methyl-5-hydroxy-6-metoxy-1,4-benzoquinol methylase